MSTFDTINPISLLVSKQPIVSKTNGFVNNNIMF